MKYLLIIVLLIVFSASTNGQKQNNFINEWWYFNIKGAIISPLDVKPKKGHLKSNYAPGFSLSTGYYSNLNDKFSISVGGGFGVTPFNLNFEIETPQQSVLYPEYKIIEHNAIDYASTYYSLSLLFHYSVHIKRKWFFDISTGINLFFFSDLLREGYMEYVIDNNSYIVLEYYSDNQEYSIQPAIALQLHFSKLIKYDKYSFGLVFNYTPKPISSGEFWFYELGDDFIYGTLDQPFNYFGLSIGYMLNMNKKTLKNLTE